MKKTSLFLLFLGMCGFFLANSGLTQDSGEPDTLYFSAGPPCSPDGDTLFLPVGGGYARILINAWNDDSITGISIPLVESVSGPPKFAFMDPVHQNASVQPLCYKGSRIEGWGSLNMDMSYYQPKVMYGAVTFGAATSPGDGLIATMIYTVNDTGRICLDTLIWGGCCVLTFVRPPSIGYTPQVVSRCFQIAHYSGDTVYVDDNASPGWYDSLHVHTIQEGIDSVAEYHMVYVHNGTYYENLTADKRLFLMGQNMDSVVVDGGGGDVLTISADGVHVSGLRVQSGGSGKGLVIYSDGNSIYGNNMKDADYGIWLADSAHLNFIFHNNFTNNTIQHAYSLGGREIWDHGYPGGGNYWDDYTGVDNNHDDIGDTPYQATSMYNNDRYPLMNPWDGTSPVPPVDTAWVDDDYHGGTPGWGFDHFDKIQEGIDAVIPGGTVLVFNGTYSEYVTIDKKVELIGEDRDSTIITRENYAIVTITVDSVKISGFKIIGVYLPLATTAILVESNYNRISGNNFLNHCKSVVLHDSYGTTVSGNILMSNYCGAVELSSAYGNTISSNDVVNGTINIMSSGNNIVSDNTVIGGGYHAVDLWGGSSGNIISGNTITSNYWDGVHLYSHCNNNTITDNIIIGDTLSENGIYLEDCSRNDIANNNISNHNCGIKIIEGKGNSVDYCTTETNSQGIHVEDADSSVIQWCEVKDNTGYGMELVGSNNTSTYGNNFIGNSYGILVTGGKNNVIAFSQIDSNQTGVYIENGDSNLIKWCEIKDNAGYGMELFGSSNISIYSNNFIGNNGATAVYDTAYIQAYDDSADVSFWNTDYPLGGNYWSDYDGIDDSSGAYQNLPGSDGIGDTPYPLHPLNVGNKDNYPLMGPWAPVCGDVDYTALVDVVDIVYLVNYKFRSGPEPIPHQCAGDVSGDGITNIVDIVYLVNYLFKSDVPPVSGCCELNY